MISNTSLNTYFPGRSTLRHLFGRVILEEKSQGSFFIQLGSQVLGAAKRYVCCLVNPSNCSYMDMGQNPAPLMNTKIAGKWMSIPF